MVTHHGSATRSQHRLGGLADLHDRPAWPIQGACQAGLPARLLQDLLHRCPRRAILRLLSGDPAVEPLPHAGTYEHMCLPCRRAFSSKVAWSGHAARLHGYRSTAYLLGDGCLCKGCGKSFSSPGRLRRHLTSVPACTQHWGAFELLEGCAKLKTAHPQAPPNLKPASGRRIARVLKLERIVTYPCGRISRSFRTAQRRTFGP